MDPTVRLRIATRIHFALLRHYGEDVSVSTLLRFGAGAREALWVCEASEQAELTALGREFAQMLNAETAARARALHRQEARIQAEAPQDAPWARDTSGFGVTRPGGDLPEPASAAPASPAGWFSAARWRRLGANRYSR